jgi:hypothetical protein
MNVENTQIANIRPLNSGDLATMLALNNTYAKETSFLDEPSLTALLQMAFYARGVDHGAGALLIAFDESAPYDNPNFRWFKQRYQRFIYVDRILVAAAQRGQGLARRLYEDLFAAALQADQIRVVCEVNLDPPNPASDAFHATMGFVEIGQAAIHNGTKIVRYFEKMLP